MSALADALNAARRDGTIVEPGGPLSEADAFAILDEITTRRGTPPAWKAGATAPGVAEKVGLSEPFIGPIFAEHLTLCEGQADVTLPEAHTLAVEVEVAFIFDRAVEDAADVLDAVGAVAVALEFPGQRWRAPLDPPGPGIIADQAGNAALVIGPHTRDWRGMDLANAQARVLIDGELAGTNPGSNVMGGPVNALKHFAQRIAARGHTITEGLILTSGGICGPLPIKPGAVVTGEIDGLSPLRVSVQAS